MHLLKAILALTLLSPRVQAQDPNVDQRIREIAGLDVDRARAFFNEIKVAVAKSDKKSLSSIVAYPTTIKLNNGSSLKIRNRSEFEAHYNEIITERVQRAVREQVYENLFVRAEGVMFGNGEVWFSARKGPSGKFDQYRITKVNN